MGPFAHPVLAQQARALAASRAAQAQRPVQLRMGLNLNPIMAQQVEHNRQAMRRLVGRDLLTGEDSRGWGIPQEALDAAALATAPFPLAGDVVGAVADGVAFAREPSLLNAGLAGLGLLPFFPGGATKRVGEDILAGAKDAILRGETSPEGLEAIRRGQAARAATPAGRRATDQGFREGEFLHGTNEDVAVFSSSRSGEATHTRKLNQRLDRHPVAFLTSDPAEAGVYALNAVDKTGRGAANITPVRVRTDRPIRMNAEGQRLDELTLLANLKIAEEAGLERFGAPPDMVFFENLPPLKEGGKPVTMAVAYDPAKLRSVFAKFDPQRASSGELLASLAGAGLLLSVARAPRLVHDRDE